MPIRCCYCQKVDHKFSKKLLRILKIVLNGECDDGCGIPLICERRDALWSAIGVDYYCHIGTIVIALLL